MPYEHMWSWHNSYKWIVRHLISIYSDEETFYFL